MNYLCQYVRNEDRKPVGCMVAIKDEDGFISIGMSLHNPKDEWDRNLARQIAMGRAFSNGVMPEIPRNKQKYVTEALRQMVNRSGRYFKDGRLLGSSVINMEFIT